MGDVARGGARWVEATFMLGMNVKSREVKSLDVKT